jgi:hypothetical protein
MLHIFLNERRLRVVLTSTVFPIEDSTGIWSVSCERNIKISFECSLHNWGICVEILSFFWHRRAFVKALV